jgi:hypothetical protein
MTFVTAGFELPRRLATEQFVLEPLGPEHNEGDYDAWTSSIEHIRCTPGFEDQRWPREMTVEENRSDLERHAADFEAREGFTFTVRDPEGGAILGCVYIYPTKDGSSDASVQSWVRGDCAQLDRPLRAAVTEWLNRDWPFARIDYAGELDP